MSKHFFGGLQYLYSISIPTYIYIYTYIILYQNWRKSPGPHSLSWAAPFNDFNGRAVAMAPATFGFKSCGTARLKAEKLGDSCRAERKKADDRNIKRMSTHVISCNYIIYIMCIIYIYNMYNIYI